MLGEAGVSFSLAFASLTHPSLFLPTHFCELVRDLVFPKLKLVIFDVLLGIYNTALVVPEVISAFWIFAIEVSAFDGWQVDVHELLGKQWPR